MAVLLAGSYELLMVIIGSTGAGVAEFAGEVSVGQVPSVRVIRARLHVGQPRAQRVRAYLTALSHL